MTEIIPKLEYVTIKRSEYDYLRAGSEWQPIETAPRDGSYIIAARFGPSQELKWVTHSRWMETSEMVSEWGGEPEDYAAGWTDGNDEDEPCYPTHWMPLEPPRGDNG